MTLRLRALTLPRFPAESRSRELEIVPGEVGFVLGQGESLAQRFAGKFSVMSKEGIRAGPPLGEP